MDFQTNAGGTVFSVFALTDDIGKGLSPLIAAALVSAAGGRQLAFNFCLIGWLVCGLLLFGMVKTLPGDVARLQRKLLREDALGGAASSGAKLALV